MDYVSIFDPIPWAEVGHSMIQTLAVYWLLLFGVKAVGRRVFGEMGPQDLIILLLVAEACDLGLADEGAGFWGTVASVLTILATGGLIERVPVLRRLLESAPVVLCRGRQLEREVMRANLVDESDLQQAVHQYGLESYDGFETMTLESDGSITGVLRMDLRAPRHRLQPSPVG
jgi:uncharacterized membrane protein YcaP (DUF421 family)